jgi:hypothetical protein
MKIDKTMYYLKIPLQYFDEDSDGKNSEKVILQVMETLRLPSHLINETKLPDLIKIVHE